MDNQSLPAQLLRWAALLIVVLVGVHSSPWLLEAFADQAMHAGCHQTEMPVSDFSPHPHHHGHHHKGHH